MTMKIALGLIPKSVIDDYAKIGCTVFGDILLQAMGINGGCSLFTLSRKHPDHYHFNWVLDDGSEYAETFGYDVIKKALVGKTGSIETNVYTR